MNKELVIAVVALLVSGFAVLFPNTTERVVETVTLGAAAGTTHSNFESFVGGLSDGGGIVASSTGTNSTLLASTLTNAKQIDHTLTTGSGTLTLPASSTLAGWLPNAGDTRTVFIRHATTTAATTLTVAVGTGITAKNATNTAMVMAGDTDGKNTLMLTFFRTALNGNFTVFAEQFKD